MSAAPLLFELIGGVLNGLDNLNVAGAAAKMADKRTADFILARARVPGEKRFCSDHHSRRTETALNCPFGHKRLLDFPVLFRATRLRLNKALIPTKLLT